MQSAIQVAHYRAFQKTVATYESASTSAFKLGRTETIRSATVHTKALSESLFKRSDKLDYSNIFSLMKEASKKHNQLVKEGAMGQGFDRHFFAMKYHAVNRKGDKLPQFFDTQSYKLLNHIILSTSTLAYPSILVGGFAPVTPDGFGIGYRIMDNSLGACLTSYDAKRLELFYSEFEQIFDDFHNILTNIKLN
jgi:carnitine O-palmitoyltransferase 2